MDNYVRNFYNYCTIIYNDKSWKTYYAFLWRSFGYIHTYIHSLFIIHSFYHSGKQVTAASQMI